MNIDSVISGAIFDFAAFLMGRKESITFGAEYECSVAVRAIQEFAALRGLNLEGADVNDWQDKVMEFETSMDVFIEKVEREVLKRFPEYR